MSTEITSEAKDIKKSWDRRSVKWNHQFAAVMTAKSLAKWCPLLGIPPEEAREVLALAQEIVSAYIENRGERD